MNDKKLIGFKDGMAVYVTDALLAEKGEREVREQFGLIRRYPVITDLSGHEVMVEGDSHEDAVQRYFMKDQKIMRLYHATTQKKAKLYRQSGAIHAPVRGFTTMQAAMAWAMKVGRVVILEFDADKPHKLPDHHNLFGEAWWNDGNVTDWRCAFSAIGDA